MKISRHIALAAVAFTLVACSSSSDANTTTVVPVTDAVEETTTTEAEVAGTEAPTPDVPANSALPALGECPTSVFPDLTAVIGAGEEYAMPEVLVE